ncbi:hypothetical protein BDV11DRAFT_189645 [Aspergillus similis]
MPWTLTATSTLVVHNCILSRKIFRRHEGVESGHARGKVDLYIGQHPQKQPNSGICISKASSEHLALSSPYFARIFKSGFQKRMELRNEGHVNWGHQARQS